VFLAQLRFLRDRMTPVLGARVTAALGEIVQRRRNLLDDAMAALELQYPGHTEAVQARMLRQVGLRFEMETYTALRDEALLSAELFEEIRRDIEARRDAVGWPVTFGTQAGLSHRLRELAPFATLPEALLDGMAKRLTMRFALPGERILRQRRRAGSVYVISYGEVEIAYDGRQLRLGRGALFGGDGMLGEARTRGAVTAVRFCHLLELRTGFFRTLLATRPELAGTPPDGVADG
jgi:CPA1 family monovalent cation:H+ antiporter